MSDVRMMLLHGKKGQSSRKCTLRTAFSAAAAVKVLLVLSPDNDNNGDEDEDDDEDWNLRGS